MKKFIIIVTVALFLTILTGCGGSRQSGSLPKGHADSMGIDFGSGKTLDDVDFEFVNEHLVKVTREDGDILYYPTERINYIIIEGEK